MPRQGRLQLPGGVFHVIVRGIERRKLFCEDADYEQFLKRLAEGISNAHVQCLSWALMPNHFHLLIRQGSKPISTLMSRVLTSYALYFNKKYKRSGYVYQNRYKSILCQENAYLLELVRYIHLNPLRAGMVSNMKDLAKYPWCGHGAICATQIREWQETSTILSLFSSDEIESRKRYAEFVKEGREMGRRHEYTGGGLVRSAGGWRGVSQLRRSKERWRGDERILGDGAFVEQALTENDDHFERKVRLLKSNWSIERLEQHVSKLFGIETAALRRRSRNSCTSEARAVFIYWAVQELGEKVKAVANYLKISQAAVSQNSIRGESITQEKLLKLEAVAELSKSQLFYE